MVPVLGVVGTTWRSILRVLGSSDDEIPGPPDPYEQTDVVEDEEAEPPPEATEPAGTT